jgi:hypothetical protein
MKRFSCLLLAGLLASSACAPAVVPATSAAPRLLLAEATPTSAPAPPDYGAPPPPEPPEGNQAASKKSETWQERQDRQLGRNWGWTAVSIGASAGVLAIGTSILMLEDNSTRSSNCNGQKVCNANGLTANAQLTDLGPWNAGFWAVGVVGLGVGAYLLLTHPTDKDMATRVGVAPNGSGASFELRSSF